MNYSIYFSLILSVFVMSCQSPDPNLRATGEDELKALEIDRVLNSKEKRFEELIYIPIYSDIYIDRLNQSTLLSATLSIRNTSLNDSIFISVIDYYNTEGSLVRSYIDQPILLSPMATVNYVIEKEDTSGGPGANFIVKLNAENPNVSPLIQAVMIGETGNKGFAFSTDGYPIN